MSYTDTAHRMLSSPGDFPSDDFGKFIKSNWDHTLAQEHDAYVHNASVYPNQSTNGASYITWMTRRAAVSQLKLTVVGTFSGLYIKLAGLDEKFPNATHGWLDVGQLYDGAGTPGVGRNGIGCAVGTASNRTSGTFICTFGSQNSTYATNNAIIVRVKLKGLDILKGFSMQGMQLNPEVLW